MPDFTRIEEQLIEARDALMAYWEQPEGQTCFLALRVAQDALADYEEIGATEREHDAEQLRRIASLVDEIARLRAPLEGAV